VPTHTPPSVLPTTLRFMASRLFGHSRTADAPMPHDEMRRRVESVLQHMPDQVLRCDWVDLSGALPDWLDSGVTVAPGAEFTLLARGRLMASRAFDVGVGPQVGLWYRVGAAPIAKLVGEASTINTGAAGGALHFTVKPPGEFADAQGNFDPAVPRTALGGSYQLAVIQWRGDADAALATAAAADPELFGPALQRRREPKMPPAGAGV
jgi:hypothetical protein